MQNMNIKQDKLASIVIITLIASAFLSVSVISYIVYQNYQKAYSAPPNDVIPSEDISHPSSYTVPEIPPTEPEVKQPEKIVPVQPLNTAPINYNLKVMVVNYNPTENGGNGAEKFYKYFMGNRTAREAENYAYNSVINHFKKLSNNRINYQVVKSIDINEFPTYPDGFKFDFNSYQKCIWGTPEFDPVGCDVRKAKFDYVKWTKDYKICEIAEANNVDEIWTLSLPYVMQWENFMIGPDRGFGVNGDSYTVDTCHKHYIVLGGAYNSLDNLMHDIGHRVEATMDYVTSVWKEEDKQKYWVNFARWGTGNSNTYNTCGNTHFPTNAKIDYEYSNYANEFSSCDDWKNFPNLKGINKIINCTNWGCSDPGWQEYWLGSLPSSAGEVAMTSKFGNSFQFKKDWWYYLLYPENAIKFVNDNY